MTRQELYERQKWTLSQKIDHTLGVIDQFVSRMDGKVYLAFSGGKDSTVLMHLCEIIKKDILCVFVNTGCEYPDILKFVRKCKEEGHNIMTIRPKYTPRDVWAKYGFPLVSKEVGESIHAIRTNPNTVKAKKALGILNPDSMFVLNEKWSYLIDEPYETSNKCCQWLKKEPSHRIQRELGLAPIIGTMATESILREKFYIRRGGVTRSTKQNLCFLPPCRCLYGQRKIYGSLSAREILRLRRYITRAQRGQAAWRVASVVSSQTIGD